MPWMIVQSLQDAAGAGSGAVPFFLILVLGRLLPNVPRKIFPFVVRRSPLPTFGLLSTRSIALRRPAALQGDPAEWLF